MPFHSDKNKRMTPKEALALSKQRRVITPEIGGLGQGPLGDQESLSIPSNGDGPLTPMDALALARQRGLSFAPEERNPNLALQRTGRDIASFTGFVEGVDPFQDVERLRALNQSTGQQLWRATKTMPANIILGLLENVGQILDLESWANMAAGEQDDFSNWLTQFAKNGKEWVETGNEIYRVNPDQVFDWLDPAWYITHGSDLTESIVSFMAVGAGSMAAFGKLASTVAKGINAGAALSRGLSATAAVGSAATLAYTEGAIEAAQVYEQRLRIATREMGMSLPEAQIWAGEGAVKTARTNMLNTLVNLTAVAPFMRPIGKVAQLGRSPLARKAGERTADYLKRIATEEGKSGVVRKLALDNAREIPQEAIEEVWNEIASAEGLVVGTDDPRSFAERLKDTLAKPETRLAALLGAVGGAGQTMLSRLTPRPRRERQEDGTVKTVFKSSFTKERAAEEVLFTDTRNDITIRLEQYQKDMKDLSDAAGSTEKDANTKYIRAQNSLFGLAAKDTIQRGIEEQIIQSYEEIGNLSEDEAIAQGFDVDPNSESYYKTLAQDKVDDVKELTKKWNDAEERYSFSSDERLSGLPEFVFSLEYTVLDNQKTLERINVQQQKSFQKFVDQLTARKISPTLADIAGRWTSIHDVEHTTPDEIMRGVAEDMETGAGRQRVRNLYGTDVISDIKKAVETQESARFSRKIDQLEVLNEDMEAYAVAEELGTAENIQKELINLRKEHSDIFEPLEKLGQMNADFTRSFLTASKSLTNISSGKGRRDFTNAFEKEIVRVIEENVSDVADAVSETETAEEFEEVRSKIATEEASKPQVKQAIAQKEADITNAEKRVEEPSGKPLVTEEEPVLTKEEFEATIKDVGTQEEADLAAQEAREGQALVEQPFVIKNPTMDSDKRAEVLESILNQTDPTVAFDIFDWYQLNFSVDRDFINASKTHIEALKRSEAGLVPLDQIQLVETADQANAPLDEHSRNTFSTEKALSKEISELGSDEDGRQTDSGGELLRTGFKNVPAASALASKSRETTVIAVDTAGGTVDRVFTASNERLADQVPEVESLRYLRKGSAVRIVVDTSNVDELIAEHGDDAYRFVEIGVEQIVNNEWKRLSFLHDSAWIEANVDGRPTHVAHMVNGRDNWEAQKKEIDQTRRFLWKNRDQIFDSTVTGHGLGHLSRNFKFKDGEPVIENGKQVLERDTIANLIPDEEIEFYVIRSGIYETKFGQETGNLLMNNQAKFEPGMNGQVGLFIPMGRTSDGEITYMATPVWIPNLTDPQVHTVWALMSGFWARPELGKQIADATGTTFDPAKNKKALSQLMGLYLYSSSFNEKTLLDRSKQVGRVLFHVGTDTGIVKISKTGSNVIYNSNPTAAGKKNGITTKYMFQRDDVGLFEHEDAIRALIGEKTLQVDLNRLNSQVQVQDIVIDLEDGPQASKVGYTSFLRNNLSTNINGTNSIDHADGSTEYTYSINRIVTVDTSFTRPKESLATPQVETDIDPESLTKPDDKRQLPNDTINPFAGMDDMDHSIGEITPAPIDIELSDMMARYSIQGFSLQQQSQILDSILLFIGRKDLDSANPQDVFDELHSIFDDHRILALSNDQVFLANEFDKILLKWKEFMEMTATNLQNIGYNITGEFLTTEDLENSTEEGDPVFEGEESNYEKFRLDDDARFTQDTRKTASARLKMFLSIIPATEPEFSEEGRPVSQKNYLGWPSKASFDSIWDQTKSLLSMRRNRTLENYLSILRLQSNPIYTVVANRIEGASSELQAEFVSAMSQEHVEMDLVMWKEIRKGSGQTIGYKINPIKANRNSQIDTVISSWIENQKQIPLTTFVEKELGIDRTVVSELKNQYQEAFDNAKDHGGLNGEWFLDRLKDTLKGMGMSLTPSAIRALPGDTRKVFRGSFQAAMNPSVKGQFMNVIFGAFNATVSEGDVEEHGLFEANNPLIGPNSQSFVRRLAEHAAFHESRLYTSSFRNVDGEQIYSYQNYHHLSNAVLRFREDDSYRRMLTATSFSEDSRWNQLILQIPGLADVLRITYVDGLKKINSIRGQKRKEMGAADQHFLALGYFQGPQRNEIRGHKMTSFMAPTLSDSTVTPLFSFVKQDVIVDVEDGSVTGISPETMQDLISIAQSEIKRISRFQAQISQKLKDDGVFSNYASGAENFYLMTYLNEDHLRVLTEEGVISEEEISQLWVDGKLIVNADAVAENGLVRKVIQHEVLQDIANLQEFWSDSGIVENLDGDIIARMNNEYLVNLEGFKTNADRIAYAAADFHINYMTFYAEFARLFAGDPAHAFKKDIATTIINVQKRLRSSISPIITGHWPPLSTYKKVTLSDRLVSSKDAALYKKRLGIDNYSEINSTDAQEYTTLEEHVRVLEAYGQIPSDVAKSIHSKIKKGEDYVLSRKELKSVLFRPMKPLAYVQSPQPEYDMINTVLTKSSSFPLIPQVLKGLQLDKLRVAMEKQGIDRAAHESADKLGIRHVQPVYTSEGHVQDSIEFEHVQTLSRDGFGLQHVVPAKDPQILTVSQMNKNLFVGLGSAKGFSFMGKDDYSGQELRSIKEKIRSELMSRARQRVLDRLSVSESIIDGQTIFRFTDKSIIRDVVLAEARRRNWSQPDIEKLELTLDEQEFVQPFGYSTASDQIMSLLLSIVNNEVIKQKLFGMGFVQASSAGWSAVDDKTGIVFIPGYDSKSGLHSLREDKDGNILPAQILIPWYFKDRSGNHLPMEDYIGEDGRINYEKLPKEVLNLIGARIPNQGPSSQLPFEIVGFIPPVMDLIAIVPDEIVTQMGSDFDVDKLYTYLTQYRVSEDGSITKLKPQIGDREIEVEPVEPDAVDELLDEILPIPEEGKDEKVVKETTEAGDEAAGDSAEEQKPETQIIEPTDAELKQAYVDLHWSVMTHQSALKRLMLPLANGDLRAEKDLIEDARGITGRIVSPLTIQGQIEDNVTQRSGGQLIGRYSSMSKFSSTIEDADLRLQGPATAVKFYNDTGDELLLTRLSGQAESSYNGQSRTKQIDITSLQNAALDNPTENLLGLLNLNEVTEPVSSLMVQMQTEDGGRLDLSYVTRMMSQDSIRYFVERVAFRMGAMSTLSPKEARESAFSDAENRIMTQYFQGLEPDQTPNFPDKGEILSVKLSPKYLLKLIENGTKDNTTRAFALGQLAVLRRFKRLDDIAVRMNSIRKAVLFADTNGAGNDLLTSNSVIAQINSLEETITEQADLDSKDWVGLGDDKITGGRELLGEFNEHGEFIKPTTELGHAAMDSLFFAFDMFSEFFPFKTEAFKESVKEVGSIIGRSLNVEQQKAVWKGMQSYIYSDLTDVFEDPNSERKRLMLGDNSIAHRVDTAKKTDWGKGNLFLQFMQTNITKKVGEPSTVRYLSSTAKRIDDVVISRDLAGMLVSKNEVEAELARDLVAYSFLVGGIQDAFNFVRYIPTGYLERIGLNAGLRSYPFDTKLLASGFIEQYVQNNPHLVQEISRSDTGSRAIPASFSWTTGEGSEFWNRQEESYPSYVAIPGKKRTYVLYKNMGEREDGNIHFEQIQTRGMSNVGVKEYGPTAETALFSSNSIIKAQINPVTIPNRRKTTKLGRESFFVKTPTVSQQYFQAGLTDPKTLLTHAISQFQNPAFKEIGDIIVGAKRLLGKDYSLEFTNQLKAPRLGSFSLSTNTVKISSLIRDRDQFESTFVHEHLHALTVGLVKRFENDKSLPEGVQPVLETLDGMRLDLRKQFEHDPAFKTFLEKVDRLTKDPETSESFTSLEFAMFYPMLNLKEFITGVMTNERFQRRLNEIQYTEDKTMMERFSDLIQSLLEVIGDTFGFQVNDQSVFAKAVNDIVGLTAFGPETIDVESKGVVDNFQYFGKTYQIQLHISEDGRTYASDVLNHAGTFEQKEKIMRAYSENPDLDPQRKDGKEFRDTSPPSVDDALPFDLAVGDVKRLLIEKFVFEGKEYRMRFVFGANQEVIVTDVGGQDIDETTKFHAARAFEDFQAKQVTDPARIKEVMARRPTAKILQFESSERNKVKKLAFEEGSEDLGTDVGTFMKGLSKSERLLFRQLRLQKRIFTECD